jgi:hypothetical protein
LNEQINNLKEEYKKLDAQIQNSEEKGLRLSRSNQTANMNLITRMKDRKKNIKGMFRNLKIQLKELEKAELQNELRYDSSSLEEDLRRNLDNQNIEEEELRRNLEDSELRQNLDADEELRREFDSLPLNQSSETPSFATPPPPPKSLPPPPPSIYSSTSSSSPSIPLSPPTYGFTDSLTKDPLAIPIPKPIKNPNICNTIFNIGSGTQKNKYFFPSEFPKLTRRKPLTITTKTGGKRKSYKKNIRRKKTKRY